jgi:hypothetical protein
MASSIPILKSGRNMKDCVVFGGQKPKRGWREMLYLCEICPHRPGMHSEECSKEYN